jgi:hypothetical protein
MVCVEIERERETLSLAVPPEPTDLRACSRRLFEQYPNRGHQLLGDGEWITCALWQEWGADLEAQGMGEDRLRSIVVSYRNELRLWVMGERPWEQCAAGLAGRVKRRAMRT